ncbi:MAG: ATP-binding protein [Planctomycetota bacterium]|nr:ATP-binding protein [Planctomycetota bacterium]
MTRQADPEPATPPAVRPDPAGVELHTQPLDPDQLSPETIRQGNLEIVRRMAPGTPVVLGLSVLVVAWTPVWIDHAHACVGLIVSQALIAVARFALHRRYPELYDRNPDAARLRFGALLCGSAASWGFFAAFAVAEYGPSWSTLLIVLCTAGILAGGTTSLCLRRNLHRVWILLVAAPLIVVSLTITEGHGLTFAGTLGLFVVFLMREAKYLHRSFWRSLEKSLVIHREEERKRRFLASISHEIRTPMTCILGMLQLVRDDMAHPSNRERLRTIDHSSRELLRLVNDLLNVPELAASDVEITPAPFDVRECLEEVSRLVQPAAVEKALPVHVDHDDDVPQRVVGDRGRVRQVMLNLVYNAVRYTGEGEVRITVERGPMSDTGPTLALAVEDTGIGMSREQIRAALFGQQHTLDANARIGLANCSYLIHRMGGSLAIESEPGEGTRAVVTLPLVVAAGHDEPPSVTTSTLAVPTPSEPAPPEAPTPELPAPDRAPEPTRPGHVVLAGGEERTSRRMQAALELGGHHVSWVEEVDQVERILNAHPARTDAVVLLAPEDVGEAAGVARRLRRTLGERITHVAMLASHPDPDDTLAQSLGSGLDGLVPRTVGVGDPVAVVNGALERRRDLSGNRPTSLVTRTLV